MHDSIYAPAEDSYLLEKQVRLHAEGRVLELGTGSGIQALAAIENPNVREVLAVDINPEAIKRLQKVIDERKLRKIKVIQSDLFENVYAHFSTIIFNPPYLPQDKGIEDAALYGGKKGWELSARFFEKVSSHLLPAGKILFLFSTLTNKEKIHELIEQNLLGYKQLASQKLAFEELYVYEITKTPLLCRLEGAGFENIQYFTHGKRGSIYKATLDKNGQIKTHLTSKKDVVDVAIKVKRESTEAQNTIENETKWLRVLNKHNIGPKLQVYGKGFFSYVFVKGDFMLGWLQKENTTKEQTLSVLRDLFNQCFILDFLQVNKEEMHHPHKHVIITKENTPVLLDFERCAKTTNPKNVTQFIEYVCRLKDELGKKKIIVPIEELRSLAAEYKDSYDRKIVAEIMSLLSS